MSTHWPFKAYRRGPAFKTYKYFNWYKGTIYCNKYEYGMDFDIELRYPNSPTASVVGQLLLSYTLTIQDNYK